MHDCALGREGGPSAPRVEHTDFLLARELMVKIKRGGGIIIKNHIEFYPLRGSFFYAVCGKTFLY